MSFIDRLWRGKIGLALTYWAFGIALPLALLAVFALLGVYFEWRGGRPPSGAAAFPLAEMLVVGYFLCFIAALVFVAVAVWRSAGRYRGPWHWPVLARLSIPAGAVLLIWKMFAAG